MALIIISLLTFNYAPNTQLSNYVSFAATISSLILAILAIIQGFFSNNSLSDTVNNLNNSSTQIVNNANKLEEIIQGFDDRLKDIPDAIKQLGDKIETSNTFLTPSSSSEPVKSEFSEAFYLHFKETTSSIGALLLYFSIKSFKNKKPFSIEGLDQIMRTNSTDIQSYCYGNIIALNSLSVITVKITRNPNLEFSVSYINEVFLDFENFLITKEEFKKGNKAKIKQGIAYIDNYFN
ncbi:hypothetical protein [Mucilaginibacter sp.]|uniref:hypothetical protein n=1 Tax=Mucilaginibacter sp. TaxID=1882438 RepID=UPI00262717FD|nr:hypothetical protein [Mucilaginibacter sp.]